MLTSWKTTHTSIEYTPSILPNSTVKKKQKKKKKKSSNNDSSLTQDVDYNGASPPNNIIGAQFISIAHQPRIADRQEKSNPSNSKKRRKVNNNHNANNYKNKGTSNNNTDEEDENKSSILCVTTPHRVVFMENDKTESSTPALLLSEDNYMESKSRNYITKPGISTSFSPALNSNTFFSFGSPPPPSSRRSGTTTLTEETFSGDGILGRGVQYDPASNLIYGIRGGNTSRNEIVIWSAVPVTTLPGPDDDEINNVVDDNVMKNGSAGGMNGSSNNKKVTLKKRKGHSSQQQQHQHHQTTTPFWGDDIIKERLQLPKDKVAVSLSPFYILLDNNDRPVSSSSSSAKKKKKGGGGGGVKTCAIGAIGCCNDGSIYVVSRFFHQHKPLNDDKFQLRIVEDTGGSLLKSNNNKEGGLSSSWKLLDSHIVSAVGNSTTNYGKSSSILLSIQSVTMSSDTKIEVSVRDHTIRIANNMKEEEGDAMIHLEKSTEQTVLELESCDYEIATKLDSTQLSIVYRNNKKKKREDNDWVFTSANLSSKSNDCAGSLIMSKTTKTCPLPNSDIMEGGTIFSFGKLGKNIIALLMKSSKSSSSGSGSIMSLRIIDFQRKSELSTYSWVEGGGDDEPSPTMKIVDIALNNILHDKVCHGMVTNEFDGSIALLTSSPTTLEGSSSSLLDIVYSKLDIMSTELTSKDDEPSIVVASKSNSLASALRFVATSSASCPIEKCELAVSKKGGQAFNLASMISSDAAKLSHQAAMDEAVDKACQTLTSSAQEMIDATLNNGGEKNSMTNGKTKKGPRSGKKSSGQAVASWKEIYQNSCTLIAKTKEGGKTNCGKNKKNLVNGIIDKGGGGLKHAGIAQVTKRFVDTAFKETATILLSLHKADASIKAQKTFQEVVQEATCILIEILETNVISARADYGISLLNRGNALLSILHACPSSTDTGSYNDVGKLHVINAMLEHVRDIHETALVSILRLLLRKASVGDAVAFYASSSTSKKGTMLSNQYRTISGSADETKRGIETKLLSEAMLDLSSKIVTYSNCNHFFLTKAMRECINTNGEVGTLLMTLTRLLKLSSKGVYPRENDEHSLNHTNSQRVTLSTGTIYWISALTDAHMGTVLKIKNERGVAMDWMQHSIRSTMAQSKLASDVRESLDLITSPKPKAIKLAPKPSIVAQQLKKEEDEAMPLYNMERLAF